MRINLLCRKICLISALVFAFLVVQSQNVNQVPQQIEPASCGMAVLDYLQQHYFVESTMPPKLSGYEVSLAEILSVSKALEAMEEAEEMIERFIGEQWPEYIQFFKENNITLDKILK